MSSDSANEYGSKTKPSGGKVDNSETPKPVFQVITSKFKGKVGNNIGLIKCSKILYLALRIYEY